MGRGDRLREERLPIVEGGKKGPCVKKRTGKGWESQPHPSRIRKRKYQEERAAGEERGTGEKKSSDGLLETSPAPSKVR